MPSRRSVLAAPLAGLAAPAFAQPARARTLRFVPQANLTSLDPIWTTAAVTENHGWTVFDTLYGMTDDLNVQPQMAEGHTVSDDGRTWLIRLREGDKKICLTHEPVYILYPVDTQAFGQRCANCGSNFR